MDMWLIEENILNAFHKLPFDAVLAKTEFSAEAPVENKGPTAVIKIEGVLTMTPNYMAKYYGGGNTTYPSIIASIQAAEADPRVKNIELHVNSGGGTVLGLFPTLDALKACSKPITGYVKGMAASAAYSIVAMCDKIIADSVGDRFGSVGIVIDGYNDSSAYSITSSGAKNKRPDHNTDEGLKEIISQLDEAEGIFVSYIAEGRGIEKSTLMDKFGNGSVFFSEKALEKGLIDEIKSLGSKDKKKSTQNADIGDKMDAKQLKAEHPGLFAEIIAMGEELGAAAKMKDVQAHLIMAEAHGAYDIAHKAIEAGEPLDALYMAKYSVAGQPNALSKQREADAAALATAAQNADTQTQGDDGLFGASVAEDMKAGM